jgi:protein-S-isoprenylcysteine O-methyltransferase Ste14
VIAPPPTIPLAVMLVAEAMRWWHPLLLRLEPVGWRWTLAVGCLVAALTLVGTAVLTLRRARTPVEPWKPTRAIVDTGPYALSRNPIYVGFLALQLAYAWGRANGWGLVLLPLTVGVLQWGVIAREERYLRERFGEPYRAYAARVRRWL